MKSILITIPALALACPVAAFAQAAPAGLCNTNAVSNAKWVSKRLLRGGKGYAATPMRQVHYRFAGPATGPVLLLLHQTPWSSNEYAEI